MSSIRYHEFQPDPDGHRDILGSPKCICGRSDAAPEHKPRPSKEPTVMSALETSGPEDTTYRDRWTLRSGEEWQADTGEAVALLVRNVLGQNMLLGWTLEDAKELRDQLSEHIASVEGKS